MNTLTIDLNHTDSPARLATLQGIISNQKRLICRLEDEFDKADSENQEEIMERIEKIQSKLFICELEYQSIRKNLEQD